ncbi:MAG: glycosyltransferase [Dissulfurispiraceae bacterium]
MEKIRILLVIDHLSGGGAEQQFLNLANHIDNDNFEPHIFITERKGERFADLSEALCVHGLTDSAGRQTVHAFITLRNTISKIRPHVIQTWLDYSTFITSITLKTLSLQPLFVASHRTSTEELYNQEVRFGKLKKRLLIWAYQQAFTVTTNSKDLKVQLENYGLKRIEVIYNGIDLTRLDSLSSREELRKQLGLDPTWFYLVFVGSLVERKGIEYLIKAVKETRVDKLCLLILGKGELMDRVRASTENDQRFKVLGFKSNAVEYIKASDLLILPSIYEGLPNVILEAMAVGTPVIATNIYGVPELIDNYANGILVSPRNSRQLTLAIHHMIDNPIASKKFVNTSRVLVRSFDLDRMVKRYQDLYSTLIEERVEFK